MLLYSFTLEFIQLDINTWTETRAGFHLPKVLGHAQAARPSGMSASSQTCARDALFGHSQLTWVPGNTGRRLKSTSTVPCAHIPIHPGKSRSLGLPPTQFSGSIQGDPKQVGWAGRDGISSSISPDGIHIHLAQNNPKAHHRAVAGSSPSSRGLELTRPNPQ